MVEIISRLHLVRCLQFLNKMFFLSVLNIHFFLDSSTELLMEFPIINSMPQNFPGGVL